jgi:hypothetical protein
MRYGSGLSSTLVPLSSKDNPIRFSNDDSVRADRKVFSTTSRYENNRSNDPVLHMSKE